MHTQAQQPKHSSGGSLTRGEKLAEIKAANGDEAAPAPKRTATDLPAKAGKARKTA